MQLTYTPTVFLNKTKIHTYTPAPKKISPHKITLHTRCSHTVPSTTLKRAFKPTYFSHTHIRHSHNLSSPSFLLSLLAVWEPELWPSSSSWSPQNSPLRPTRPPPALRRTCVLCYGEWSQMFPLNIGVSIIILLPFSFIRLEMYWSDTHAFVLPAQLLSCYSLRLDFRVESSM